jgi:hypothetical protein
MFNMAGMQLPDYLKGKEIPSESTIETSSDTIEEQKEEDTSEK